MTFDQEMEMEAPGHRNVSARVALVATLVLLHATAAHAAWTTYAGNSQHTAVSAVAAQPLERIRWTTPVDLAPPSGTILIHYGSPLVTSANTVIVPVKTGSTGAPPSRRAAGAPTSPMTTRDEATPRSLTGRGDPGASQGDRGSPSLERSFTPFSNSLTLAPSERARSGSRWAPKSTITMTRMTKEFLRAESEHG
jgi:hypothetical protein